MIEIAKSEVKRICVDQEPKYFVGENYQEKKTTIMTSSEILFIVFYSRSM